MPRKSVASISSMMISTTDASAIRSQTSTGPGGRSGQQSGSRGKMQADLDRLGRAVPSLAAAAAAIEHAMMHGIAAAKAQGRTQSRVNGRDESDSLTSSGRSGLNQAVPMDSLLREAELTFGAQALGQGVSLKVVVDG